MGLAAFDWFVLPHAPSACLFENRSYIPKDLFKPQTQLQQETNRAGPGNEAESQGDSSALPTNTNSHDNSITPTSSLVFAWYQEIKHLDRPPLDQVTYRTDMWALRNGKASVTPLRATFAAGGEDEGTMSGGGFGSSRCVSINGGSYTDQWQSVHH